MRLKKGVKTRNNYKAEILKDFRTGNDDYPVAAIIHYNECDKVEIYTREGKFDDSNRNNDVDLINL